MKLIKSSVLCSVLLFISSNVFAGYCLVKDPTGTPLNVRKTPNGEVVGKLASGTLVDMEYDIHYDKRGKEWSKIYNYEPYEYLGFVFRSYVKCYDSPAPMMNRPIID